MKRLETVVALFADLEAAELSDWVARAWVRPLRRDDEVLFEEIDIARVRLIHDIRRGMAVSEDTVPLVLSLLDQVHTLHDTLAAIARVLDTQPPPVRDAILAVLDRRRG